MKDRKSELSQDEAEISIRWRRRDICSEADEVSWPEVKIPDRSNEAFEADSLSVVHVSLGWIITEETVDHDLLLGIGKPSILPTSTSLSLAR